MVEPLRFLFGERGKEGVEEGEGILVVIDGEAAVKTDYPAVAAEEPGPEGVKGPYKHPRGPGHHGPYPFGHLPGCFIGKGHCQNGTGI